ncbi:MAG: glycosyl hydrolase [Clostridiales bacterium]|nr:glycosyl hydrolase [Clostridiales bacterium]
MERGYINKIIAQMTLEEKAGLCSGADVWHTKAVKRLGVPSVMMSDGPHGLRKQAEEGDHLGIHDSIKAVCFPAGCALAASFDRELLSAVGEALGNECQAEGVGILLGPAINIKRSPLCGRNFEYFSEDPFLTGELAAAFINGVQSKNVGTSAKHYLANNQETRRMSVSAEADQRTLREIYLAAFETPVKMAKPWSVMCSYNKVNGEYVAESRKYLTDVVRDEWGFDGFVVSDWGAVNDRVRDLIAGLELEMPFSGGARDREIADAVRSGQLDEAVLDSAVERILNIVYRITENRDSAAVFDREADHALAREAAAETAVLLKNNGVLPLREGLKIAFIGQYAAAPRYQGGGSSHINAHKVTSALDAAPAGVIYAKGFDDAADTLDQALLHEALAAAKSADAAVIFAGLPDAWESEGFDRPHMRMPDAQNELIMKIAAVQPNTIVVLHNGAPVEMPWLDNVKGLLEVYLGGEAVGGAVIDILYGKTNPSGRLPESLPKKLEDNPSYLNFPGEGDTVGYREGIFVGYRYYDKTKRDVLFPFGFGLSYTTFKYTNLQLSTSRIKDTDTLVVSMDVTNTGSVFGKETVQLYVADQESTVTRPVKELRGFDKISLSPGETKTVVFRLNKRAFAYYSTEIADWYVESGAFDIIIAKSAAEPVLTKTVHVESTASLPHRYTADSIFLDIRKDEKAWALVEPLLGGTMFGGGERSETEAAAISPEMLTAMLDFMPLRSLLSFGCVTPDDITQLIDRLNSL